MHILAIIGLITDHIIHILLEKWYQTAQNDALKLFEQFLFICVTPKKIGAKKTAKMAHIKLFWAVFGDITYQFINIMSQNFAIMLEVIASFIKKIEKKFFGGG